MGEPNNNAPPGVAQPTAAAAQPAAITWFESFRGTIVAVVGIVTLLMSAITPVTEWIRGINAERLKVVEENAKLAESYLGKLTAEKLSINDRVLLFSALAELKDHPLQVWAKRQIDEQQKMLELLKKDIVIGGADYAQADRAELKPLNTNIDIVIAKLKQAKSYEEIDSYRTQLASLYRQANAVQARIDLDGNLSVYKQMIRDDFPAWIAGTAQTAALTVPKALDDKLQKAYEAGKRVAFYATDPQMKVAALRLAAVAAWDRDNHFTEAGEVQAQAADICAEKRTGPAYSLDRDCMFMIYAEALSAHRKFFQEKDRPGDRLGHAAQVLRVINTHPEIFLKDRAASRSEGADSAVLNLRNIVRGIGCELRPDYIKDSQSERGKLATRYIDLFKSVDFEVGPPKGPDCELLPIPDTIWP